VRNGLGLARGVALGETKGAGRVKPEITTPALRPPEDNRLMTRPRIAPYLTVTPAAAAIAFYTAAFGAKQRALMPAVDGLRIAHCELLINGGSVMLADAFLELGQTRQPIPGDPATVSVSLEYDSAKDVDDLCARAASLGAKIETQPVNSFWGTRFATLRDPFGHRWILNAPLDKGTSEA